MSSFYSFRQNKLSNQEYLQKFQNHVDVVLSFGCTLHDPMINNIVASRDYNTEDYTQLNSNEIDEVLEKSKKMYMALVFIDHACPIRYKKLQDELENDFSKGNDLYPKTLVKAYHLLNEFKSTKIKIENPVKIEPGLTFAQKHFSVANPPASKKKEPHCFGCGKKGWTIVSFPDYRKNRNKKVNKDDRKEERGNKKLAFTQEDCDDT